MTDERLDQILKQALSPEIENEKLLIHKLIPKEEVKMKHWNMKKTIVVAGLACTLLGTSVCAAGKITSLVSTGPVTKYNNFNDIEKAEKKTGIDIEPVKTFQNGYQFLSTSVDKTSAKDENGHSVFNYNELSIEYVNSEGTHLTLYCFEDKYDTTDEASLPTPTSSKTINGTQVNYYSYHYKFVPVDYELTKEDIENQKRADYEISYGSDKVEEMQVANIDWVADGIHYSILDMGAKESPESLFSMADELLQ